MPTAPSNSIAILNNEGQVTTFVRGDVPTEWRPPTGHTHVISSELPRDWEYAPTPPLPVPAEVTQRQMRLWLLSQGITETQIEDAINLTEDATQRAAALIEFRYATVYRRDHPLVEQIGVLMDKNSSQIDDGFRAAILL